MANRLIDKPVYEVSGLFGMDEDTLILLRAADINGFGEEGIPLQPVDHAEPLDAIYPGGVLISDEFPYEILAIFRLCEEVDDWVYLAQKIINPRARRVPDRYASHGISWGDSLPTIVKDYAFPSREDAVKFFGCLMAPENGKAVFISEHEILQGGVKVVSKGRLQSQPQLVTPPYLRNRFDRFPLCGARIY